MFCAYYIVVTLLPSFKDLQLKGANRCSSLNFQPQRFGWTNASFSIQKSSWGPFKFRSRAATTADFVMAAKQRLQELFAKYDTSGDGVLSEEEMLSVPLANVFLKDDG